MIAISDLKYAVRLLSKRPGFTILIMLVMAAGIGLSLYLFSFMNTMIFKPLPFKDGESLVQISLTQNGVRQDWGLNLHDYYEVRTNLHGISEFGAYKNVILNVSGRDGARRYNAVQAEPNIFQLTRAKPVLGRGFTDAENQMGAEDVVVIGYDIWQNQFGGVDDVLGQTLRINGVNHRIIGVMHKGYFFPSNAELWVPMRQDATRLPRGNADNFRGLGHLKEGISLGEVNRELGVVMQRLEERYPKTNNGIGAYVDTIPMALVGEGIPVVYSMHVAAMLILLLASINVGNLLLSRSIERGKETAIRVALGAPRWRLVSQMLWESVIICGIGGIIGLLVVAWGLGKMEGITATFFVDRVPFWWKFGIDLYAVKVFLLFVLATILVTGLLPAWRNSGQNFNAVLRDGTRGSLGKKTGQLNRVLVISEIFLSMTILIVASVIIVATYIASNTDNGANVDNVLTSEVLLTESKYDSPEKQLQFAKALQSRMENGASVGDVVISTAVPGDFAYLPTIAIEGNEYTKDRGYPRANYISIMPGSLAKLGVQLKEGRYFSSSDDGLDKRTIIVTDSFVSRYFKNDMPIGKRIRVVELDDNNPNWLTIVGVVEHTIQGRANEESGKRPSIFRPFTQAPHRQMTIAMQMKSDRSTVTQTLRTTLESIDPELPAFRIEPYSERAARYTAPMKFTSIVFLLFGAAAVILAGSGIYGVMSNTVSQRTQEIGVKRALGATEQRIAKEFLHSGLRQLLWGGLPGLFAGCGMGLAMAKTMGTGQAGLLLIAVIVVSVVGGVVILATYFPTKRALEMEPSQALHYE